MVTLNDDPKNYPESTETFKVGSYRVGNHKANHVYRVGLDRETDEEVAVAHTPEMGKLIARALNRLLGEA